MIGSVELVGVEPPARGHVLAALGLSSGAPYEKAALDARIDRYIADLRKHGYYEAKVVPVPRLAEDDRVADLTITVETGPHVRVQFEGDPIPGDKQAELVPIEREGSADEDLLEDSSNRIEDYLRGEGYRDAKAPHARQPSGGELLITFTITKGPPYRVQRVEIAGNASVPRSDIDPGLRVRAGQPFSQAKLDLDRSMVEALYRRRGFAGVRVVSSVEKASGEPGGPQQALLVALDVTEGPRTLVTSTKIQGNQSVPESTLRQGLTLEAGQPFRVDLLQADKDAIQIRYANLGYRSAAVDADPQLSSDGMRADVVFTVHEGPRMFVDHVLVTGNVHTSSNTILRALQIKPGDPLGLADELDARQRLAALGLFRRTDISELRHGAETRRDLVVSVEEAPATTIGYGGGGEVLSRQVRQVNIAQQTEFAPRASFQIGRRNLFGKNRSVDLFASASLLPRDSPVFAGQPQPRASESAFGFAQYRVTSTFREPHLFATASDAFVSATSEQQIRSSFNFARRGMSAGVARRLTRAVSVTGSYQIQRTKVFDESIADLASGDLAGLTQEQAQNILERLFPNVRISSFASSIIRDTRNDPVDPRTGTYLSANGQIAARGIGSDVGFAKSYFTTQFFHPLPRGNRVVLAGSARLGLAAGFPHESGPNRQIVDDLPISERFFAGGDTTIRGFALDTVGVRHNPAQPAVDTIQNGSPIGGNGLIILNGEARIPIRWGVGVVGFIDAGNVFARAAQIDLGQLRASVGTGLRYRSPIGPLRIDWGFKLHRELVQQVVAGVPTSTFESRSAIWISFGQAF